MHTCGVDSCYAFVVDHHSAPAQFCRDASISVVAPVFQSNLLNSRSHCHVLFLQSPTVKVAVEPPALGTALPVEPHGEPETGEKTFDFCRTCWCG
jgi:hypothetical protein